MKPQQQQAGRTSSMPRRFLIQGPLRVVWRLFSRQAGPSCYLHTASHPYCHVPLNAGAARHATATGTVTLAGAPSPPPLQRSRVSVSLTDDSSRPT